MNGVFQGEGTTCEDDSINCDPNSAPNLNSEQPQVNIYPNPASTELNVNIQNAAGITRIEIYSVTGQILTDVQNSTDGKSDFTQKFDISEYPAGVYLIKTTGSHLNNTSKLIKY